MADEQGSGVVRWLPLGAGLALLAWVAVAVAGGGPGLVVAGLLPALLALRVAWWGYRTAREGDGEEARTVVGWIAGGGAVMALVAGWFALLEWLGVTPTPAVAGATVVGAGALLGLRVGRSTARARRKVREATRERLARRYAEQRRERVTLLNRILRHNVRNALSVIVASAESLGPHVDGAGTEHVERIRERTGEVNDTVDTVQRVAETLAGATDLAERDLAADLRAAVDRARESHPGARFDVEDPPADATVLADDLLERVLYAQLDNAVEHNDTDEPRVRVTCERRDDRLVVRVADDGPGIPDDRKDLVFDAGDRGVTTEGDGIDLFLAEAVLERYGGTIDVEDNDPRGAVFVTEFPVPGSARPAETIDAGRRLGATGDPAVE